MRLRLERRCVVKDGLIILEIFNWIWLRSASEFSKVSQTLRNIVFICLETLLDYTHRSSQHIQRGDNFIKGTTEFFRELVEGPLGSSWGFWDFGFWLLPRMSSCSLFSWRLRVPCRLTLASRGSFWFIVSDRSDIERFILLFALKVSLPDHNNLITSSRDEVLSTRGISDTVNSTLMSIKSIENVAIPDIPNLESWIKWPREQVTALGVESNWGYSVIVSIIVLEESLRSHVPYFDFAVRGPSCDASPIWMEFYWVNDISVVSKSVDLAMRILTGIPEFDCLVVRSRDY